MSPIFEIAMWRDRSKINKIARTRDEEKWRPVKVTQGAQDNPHRTADQANNATGQAAQTLTWFLRTYEQIESKLPRGGNRAFTQNADTAHFSAPCETVMARLHSRL